MADTEQTSNNGSSHLKPHDKGTSVLHELMGLHVRMGDSSSTWYYMKVDPKDASADWQKVIQRLASHPEEATICRPIGRWQECEPYPLLLALKNEARPITVDALRKFIEAYPDVVTRLRSEVMDFVLQNPVLVSRQEIMDVLLQASPKYLSGQYRSRTFQIMGFPSSWQGQAFPIRDHYEAYTVDWQALETHLNEHPEEASILCAQECGTKYEFPRKVTAPPCERYKTKFVFPLEAAVQFETSPVPLSTVQLLLRLCPEAATTPDSSALFMVCACKNQVDPHVVQAILQANPTMASTRSHYLFFTHQGLSLPILQAMFKPSMACLAQIVPELIAACPSSLANKSNNYSSIPLQVITDHDHLTPDLLRVLLQNGHRYNANDLNPQGQTFVRGLNHSAMGKVLWRNLDILEMLPSERPQWCQLPEQREMIWQNYCLLLQAAGAHIVNLMSAEVMSADDMWDYPLLHAVIEFAHHQTFFDKVFQQSTIAEKTLLDPLGRSTLVVAIQAAGRYRPPSGRFHFVWEENKYNLDSYLVLKMLTDDRQGGSAALASIPYTWRRNTYWPLHLALDQEEQLTEDEIDLIAMSFPPALSIPDPETGFVPCLMAAVYDFSLSTIYRLIIRSPEFIFERCQPL